jgi:hypothetical protein
MKRLRKISKNEEMPSNKKKNLKRNFLLLIE